MHNWNVIATIRNGGLCRAMDILGTLGMVAKTRFHDVLVMNVGDMEDFLGRFKGAVDRSASMMALFGRVVPLTHFFIYQNLAEFELKAQGVVSHWRSELAGRRFLVRVHRRGFKGTLFANKEERLLTRHVLRIAPPIWPGSGLSSRVSFADPDAVIVFETVGSRVGASLWKREQLRQFSCLNLVHGVRWAERHAA